MKRSIYLSLLCGLSSLFLFLSGVSLSAQSLPARDESAIRAIMQQQEDCWNKGDLSCFMEGYWRDEALKFIGKNGITYGWEATLARYRKSYPDKATMGKLSFNLLHLESISKKAALVVGQWQLQREKDAPGGYFSLLWKKIGGKWVIVADHSS
jgi:hypothetical protein